MSTRRERQQLAKRSRQRCRRRTKADRRQQKPDPQPQPQPEPQVQVQVQDPHIGFFALEGREPLRHDEAVLIVGVRSVIQQILKRQGRTAMTIHDVTFREIMMGLVEGAAFCFDDQAYARLLKPAREAGLALQARDAGEAKAPGEPVFRLQLDFAGAQHD